MKSVQSIVLQKPADFRRGTAYAKEGRFFYFPNNLKLREQYIYWNNLKAMFEKKIRVDAASQIHPSNLLG